MTTKRIDSKRRIKQVDEASETAATAAPRRIDRLAEVVDLCIEAKRIADGLDEKLLSYLLAMAIQETRAGMRQEVSAAAGTVTAAPQRMAEPPTTKPRRGRGAG